MFDMFLRFKRYFKGNTSVLNSLRLTLASLFWCFSCKKRCLEIILIRFQIFQNGIQLYSITLRNGNGQKLGNCLLTTT